MRRFMLSLLLCYAPVMLSQEKDFNAMFLYVATDLMHANPDRAIVIADSLYDSTPIIKQKISALMLASNVHYRNAQLIKMLPYIYKAQALAEQSEDYDWQIRIHGFYASMYRSIRFYEQSQTHLEQVERLLPKMEHENQKATILVLTSQEKAQLYKDQKQYDKILPSLNKATKYYALIQDPKVRALHSANYEWMKAAVSLHNKDYQQSQIFYHNVLDSLNLYGLSNHAVKGYVYIGLSKIASDYEMDSAKALEYLQKAEAYVNQSNIVDLESYYHTHLRDYYYHQKDWERYEEEVKNIKALDHTISTEVNRMLTNLFKEYQIESEQLKSKTNFLRYTSYLLLFAFLLAIPIVLYRRRKTNLRMLEIVQELKDLKNIPATSKKSSANVQVKSPLLESIAENTLKQIIDRLATFETTDRFLQANFGIEDLSAYCDSNVRYVSEVIKVHKKQNFANYINKLRVLTIATRLKENVEYRGYKIAYLAEIAGFSSHSKFSSEFKKFLGISPSVFIKNIHQMSNEQ